MRADIGARCFGMSAKAEIEPRGLGQSAKAEIEPTFLNRPPPANYVAEEILYKYTFTLQHRPDIRVRLH